MGDTEYIGMILKLLIFFPLILLLIYASLKYGSKKINFNSKYGKIKVLQRVPITKDTTLIAVKIFDKGFIMVSSANKTETVMELDSMQVEILEKDSDALKNNCADIASKIVNSDMIKNAKFKLQQFKSNKLK